MSWKGLISRMSDECLMKQEMVFPFYTQYQAVMRKFTLAGKTIIIKKLRIVFLFQLVLSREIFCGILCFGVEFGIY